MKPLLLWLSLCAMISTDIVRAEEITIAAASDLNFAFKELISDYETASGNQVKLTLGSSGNFFAQIQNGAPFDLYFSADISYPKKLEEAGQIVPGSLYRYAIGRIVLWTRHESPVDVTQGIAALRQSSAKTIAIANPRHAPYGRAAIAAMEHFNIYDDVKDRLVLGENVSQAAQFVESGAADIGIIALSLALAPAMSKKGTYWEIPTEAHPTLEQGAVIVKASKRADSAKQFLEFVKSRQGAAIMTRYGFVAPESR
ncbi:MAG: molybdate ABC transporter substrate-binding protein [Nitrospira sp. CG24B]|nr:MAG: molybdate ABC transporter substrate-binding protein [Nitrospira sp. CG24B]